MSVPFLRFTLRRMLIVVAIAAGTVACVWSLTPTLIYGPITTDLIMLSVASPIGPDGRKGTYTEAEWAVLIARMSSTAVLDAALADPRIARLTLFHGPAAPQAVLSGLFRIHVTFSEAETDSHAAVNGVLLHVYSTTAVHDIADALADVIAAKGPAGITVVGRPTGIMICPIGQIPWHRDRRPYTIATVSLAAILAVLMLPSSVMKAFVCRSKPSASSGVVADRLT
jgi:hypothetical protein